jgi:hypothetical protein
MIVRGSLAVALLAVTLALAQQGTGARRWQMYEREMQNPDYDPPDAWEKTEFAWGRLRYRSNRNGFRGARWGVDANKSDRQFLVGLRRLTRIHARSVEQIVDVDSDDMFNYPVLYAVGVGDWVIDDFQAARLRQFFERGGFLMVDDFHNEREWADFMAGVNRIYPGHQAEDLPLEDPIFHTVYAISERFRVPGLNVVHGNEIERGGTYPAWRGVRDSRGRIVIAICFNQDLGDAWEWADIPEYPEKFATMAYHIGINYVMYALTH